MDVFQEELLKGDDRVIAEAKRRFDYAEDYESNARQLELMDIKFAHGDSDNHYQWPYDIRSRLQQKVTLTVNKTRQHCLQIINDSEQNKPSIKIRPTGNGATFEAAETFEGIMRYIEYISNAQAVYLHAIKYQVTSGIGYWRIVTNYAHDDSFDQEIFIQSIKDPRSVYIDPDVKELDALDAKWAFVFDDMPKEDFLKDYPEDRDVMTQTSLSSSSRNWIKDNSVRVAEYFRVTTEKDKLLHITDPQTEQKTVIRASKLSGDLLKEVMDDPNTQSRDIEVDKVEWFLIAGDRIIDRRDWPGKYIPIIRCVGEELEIEGRLHRAGHVRYLKDAQRMYNYWTSAATEAIALQSKTPYIAAKKAIEGSFDQWKDANSKNYSVLIYNHVDEQNNPIPAPQRQGPPQMSQGYVQGMQTASTEMMMASGQYQAAGQSGENEISGKAINERQRQGEMATAHFLSQQAISITATGKVILDLIPKIYDVPRVIKILAQDGEESNVQLDPNAKQAFAQKKSQNEQEAQAIFNPNVGKYWVQADIGPAYATQRQEAFNAITQILIHNQNLTPVIGDLLFKNADFPGADEIAERLERMVPPQAKGEPAPNAGQIAMDQKLQQHMQRLTFDNEKLRLELKGKDQQKEIDVYEALTKRMQILFEHHQITPKDWALMNHDLVKEEHLASLEPVDETAIQGMTQSPQPQQAQ